METTLSTISLFPSTKEELEIFVYKTVKAVNDGEIDPLKLKAQIKFIQAAIESIDKNTRDAQLRELSNYGKSTDIYGYRIEQAEVGTKYDFNGCNDPELIQLEEQAKDVDGKLKARQAMLKALNKPTNILNESTGEVFTTYPPVKSSTTSLKFSML